MTEFENVRDALKDAIEIADAKSWGDIKEGGTVRPVTIQDVQDLMQERLYNIADLLGMSDLYLEGENDEVHD
ncbi:hypothetical protein [Pediococcus pentosaceus]|jgi:hypothetical protein|uniref:Uncharacterized protein n=2 Tax=Pediococcus pentosaceus TaxID=1255 RepID=A0A0R2H4Y8_PEDPE|nr:hypothetical protein [Pediococcus pentosaceus]AHA04362.1 hypothetical protein T256_00550 [Pediococcus pentosaceus SL4]ARW20644.1 hypothetical protein S100892_02109 [Pediococcus pentosaceus]AVL02348.1 hypothetical protein PP40703_05815 [Pediococcus pentosaceus]KAF0392574.1 hypothetical protein GBO69_07710 [Pediococcus pentosaceus]KAF0433308.1 hypothetical protein GBO89_08015 [Pediococcus pentosaceus]